MQIYMQWAKIQPNLAVIETYFIKQGKTEINMRALKKVVLQMSIFFLTIFLLFFVPPVSAEIHKHNVQYLSPVPDAKLVSNETNIIVRYDEYIQSPIKGLSSLFHVQGSTSGYHSGKAIISDDNRTVVFKIDNNFEPGEAISVKLPGNLPQINHEKVEMINYSFEVSPNREKLYNDEFAPAIRKENDFDFKNYHSGIYESTNKIKTINGVSLPSDFPTVDVKVMDNPDSGYIFLSNHWNSIPYIMIFENSGMPVYYKRLNAGAYDFKVQPTGILTYFIGSNDNLGSFVVMDSSYIIIDSIRCKNGYITDLHDLQVLPNGHVLLIARDQQIIDMSMVVPGGNPNAKVIGNHIQELDKSKNVVFEWRSWDHFKIVDAVHENLTAATIDYVHINAIDVDDDGNLLISSRHLSEVTKINRQTGEIMWRLGGANNQFTFVNDPYGFSYQHDIRAQPNGNYTLFDNGNYHSPRFSRAVEYQLDTLQKTATLVWEYQNDPGYFAHAQGNVQRLPNGNTLINWALHQFPKLTEVRPDGRKAYELDFAFPVNCYRTFRFPWRGKAAVPYLIAEPHSDRVALIFNKFGDSNVMEYIIYGGESPQPTTRIDSTTNTSINLTNLTNYRTYYFRVTAIDSSWHESDYSNEVKVFTKFAKPGDNLILNGDFSSGDDFWTLQIEEGAVAKGNVTSEGEYHLEIINGGLERKSVQLVQSHIELVKSKRYLFEFDGRAANPRTVDAKIEQYYQPWTNYGKIGSSYFNQETTHFSYYFYMLDQSTYGARVVFNCGTSNADVFIDNISLKEIVDSAVDGDNHVLPSRYELLGNHPNPFNLNTTIRYAVPAMSNIKINVIKLRDRFISKVIFFDMRTILSWKFSTWSYSRII